jgi:hypothetical protein
MFGPVKDALDRRQFSDDNELKQNFRDVLLSGGENFVTLVYSIFNSFGKSVLKMKDFVKKAL